MKFRLLPAFVLGIILVISLVACRKTDENTYSFWIDTTQTNLIVKVNQNGFVLNYYEGYEYELLDLYTEDLEKRLTSGRYETFEDSTAETEFVVRITAAQFQERISSERKCWENFDISVLGLSVKATLIDIENNQQTDLQVWLEVRDDLFRNEDGDCEIDATDVSAVVSDNTTELRRKIRKALREWRRG